jgi:hypothetical protein
MQNAEHTRVGLVNNPFHFISLRERERETEREREKAQQNPKTHSLTKDRT